LRSTFRSASRFAVGVIWLFLPRQDKVGLAVQAIMALVVAVVLVSLAVGSTTATWTWARPRLPRRLAELAFA
jgi:hypothetical protein